MRGVGIGRVGPACLVDHSIGWWRTRRVRGQRVGYGQPSVEKALGALPVVAEYCRRLDLAGIVDRACPIREDVAILTHGQVIEALVANRLTSPMPLWRVAEWARGWAVDEAFGIEAAALNDDRIGRALDAIAPQLDHIVGSVGVQAITAFGVDVSRLHWDMTSISLFYGAYQRSGSGPSRATVRAPQGPSPGSETDPDRVGGHRRWRGAGVPPLSVPETMHTARDLLLRLQQEPGMIRRWRCS